MYFFSFSEEKKYQKEELFSKILSVSTVETVDEGRCHFKPCQLLKKLDQNFLLATVPLAAFEYFR